MHGARKYKTAVTDYEGMQAVLDTHSEQGWKLASLTPDTWRRGEAGGEGMDTPPFEELESGAGTREYSASYYLLVFERDDAVTEDSRLAVLEEALPQERPVFEM